MSSSPAAVVLNVPDAIATEIPPSRLVFTETDTVDFTVINKKKFTGDQVSMWLNT